MKRQWEVIEDNGGGFSLFVFEYGKIVYGATDFE